MLPEREDMTAAEEDMTAAVVPEVPHMPVKVEDPAERQAAAEHIEAEKAELHRALRTQLHKGMAERVAPEQGRCRLGSS